MRLSSFGLVNDRGGAQLKCSRVETAPEVYKLLDVHQLLVDRAKIHELATQAIGEQNRAQLIQTQKMANLGRMVA